MVDRKRLLHAALIAGGLAGAAWFWTHGGWVIFAIPQALAKWTWIELTTDARVDRANADALRAEGDVLLARIRAHAEQHGRPPESLRELDAPPEGWDDWHYAREGPEDAYVLWIGDYTVHHFHLRYDTRRGDWYLDA